MSQTPKIPYFFLFTKHCGKVVRWHFDNYLGFLSNMECFKIGHEACLKSLNVEALFV